MVAPARVPLGASTTNRKWYLDVDTSVTDTPTWTPVNGIMEFTNSHDSNLEDDSDFDSGGFGSSTKTGETWGASFKVARKVTAASALAYDPGQEFLRDKSIGKMGPANSAKVRWYEMEEDGPREEAYSGRAAVTWDPDGGGVTALSTASVTLQGQGQLTQTAHPDAA
jgi:hypothetical protein